MRLLSFITRTGLPALLFGVLLSTYSVETTSAQLAAVKRIEGLSAPLISERRAGDDEPMVLDSADAARQVFDEPEFNKLASQVDFQKQQLAVFVWYGSGQDRVSYNVLESFPEQVNFSFRPGRTRDLRRHVAVFALRKNVRIKNRTRTLPATKKIPDQFVRVEARGEIDSQVAAIGGETTGTTLTADGVTFELDFGTDQKMRTRAQQLHGRIVQVAGRLTVRAGVEIRQRWIVQVQSLVAADEMAKFLDERGQLKHPIVLRSSQTGFAGRTGNNWTINPDGRWQRQPFRNEKVLDPDRQGKLRPEQLQRLVRMMIDLDITELPPEFGKPPEVNPFEVSFEFGDAAIRLVAIGGYSLEEAVVQNPATPEERFVAFLLALKNFVEASEEK